MPRASSKSCALKMTRRPPECRAFTLVEVVLAIGIFAFAIVAVLGLTSVSMKSNQQASADTTLALMTQTGLSQLRSRGFATINGTGATAGQTIYFNTGAGRVPDYYFDLGGRLATKSDGSADPAPHADSLYSCTVYAVPTSSPSLLMLRLQFRWPLSAPPANQETRTLYASIANRD